MFVCVHVYTYAININLALHTKRLYKFVRKTQEEQGFSMNKVF